MSIQSVLLPLFVQVALTFVLLICMGRARVPLVQSGQVKPHDIALGQPNWPDGATQISNAYSNQFQLPVLFYLLTVLAWITRQADVMFVVLAWLFVLLRIGHAVIHTTSNQLSLRFFVFTAGLIVLLLMWIIFAVRILMLPA